MYKIVNIMNSSIINMHKNNKQGDNIASFQTCDFEAWNDADVFKYISALEEPECHIDVIKESPGLQKENQLIQLETGDQSLSVDDLIESDSLPHFYHAGRCLLSLSDLFDFKVLKYPEISMEKEDGDDSGSLYDQLTIGYKDRETITIIDSKNRTSDQMYFDQRAKVIESVIESHRSNLTDDSLLVATAFIRQVLRRTDLPKTINFYHEKNADLLFVAFSITQPESWVQDGPVTDEEFEYCLYFPGKCDLDHCRICNRIIFLIKFTSSKNSRDAITVAKLYVAMMRNSIQIQDDDLVHEEADSESDEDAMAGFI